MQRPSPRPILLPIAFVLVFLTVLPAQAASPAASAPTQPSGAWGVDGAPTPPAITAPTFLRPAVQVDPEALPDRARGWLPSTEAEPFFVTLEARHGEPTVDQLTQDVVAPVLAALGFAPGLDGLAVPQRALDTAALSLPALAEDIAYEYAASPDTVPKADWAFLETLLGEAEPTAMVEKMMDVAHGVSFADYAYELESPQRRFVYAQHVDGVPVEHAGLIAAAWPGQTVHAVYGALIGRAVADGGFALDAETAGEMALAALVALDPEQPIEAPEIIEAATAAWLPAGNDGKGQVRLRPTWRMVVHARWLDATGFFVSWLDAETGSLLRLDPQIAGVTGSGKQWHRDPGLGNVTSGVFEVDPASPDVYQGGAVRYKLERLQDGIARIGQHLSGPGPWSTQIEPATNGSSPTFANFDQPPANNSAWAYCNIPNTYNFQETDLFGTLHRYHRSAMALGMFAPFPTVTWQPVILYPQENAWSDMRFGRGLGFAKPNCPDYYTAVPGNERDNVLHFANDHTIVGHEFAHNAVDRLTHSRPTTWCGPGPCPIPTGWDSFHDLADAWADHYENTPCVGGWVAKNLGGTNASRNCAQHHEGQLLPRLTDAPSPFDSSVPGDHFPEKRGVSTWDYAYGQVAAAALWQVRAGMRSKCKPSGTLQYWTRFVRALKETGFLGAAPATHDFDRFRMLLDLELQMVRQWASPAIAGLVADAASTNKVTAGFARAGVFLIPTACLDGNPSTLSPLICPNGDSAGDAVIDIDDNDPADDPVIDGVTHREVDYLELGGTAPTFEVWTGPRWRLTGTSAHPVTGTPLCHARYRVEVSTDAAFPPSLTIDSGWATVDLNVATPATPECYGTFTPTGTDWQNVVLANATNGTRVYYRVFTESASGADPRVSTAIANGLFPVPPSYAVLTTDGRFGSVLGSTGNPGGN